MTNYTDRELEKLREKRKGWVESSKENNFDFGGILVGSYSDPSHFIYEILQNAEDERAKEVKFELFEDRLDIYHNGKDFDLKDIDGVTGIGISKKKDDLTVIGEFGVGFKSVFAVTETPYIFSGDYRIKIEDFVIPSAVSGNKQVNGTLIRLPFNHELRSREEVFKLISEKLANIGLKTLLFLKNIEDIEWQTPSSSGHYSKSSKSFPKIQNVKKVVVKASNITEEYIVIGKPIRLDGIQPEKDKGLKIEIAYKLGKGKRGKKIIVQEPNSKLFVFFPTDKPTYLNFVIQGPYKTTHNRENIPLEDKQNKVIIEETGNLVAESLSVIKNLGYLDVNFLNLLPIESEHMNEQIYPVIYQKVKEKLLSEKLLPTSDHKYTKADNSLLARGKELTEFLKNKDIQKLFSKHDWLDANITYDKTRELRDYFINELKIEEIDFENFASKITNEFIQATTDKWMLDFYKRLLSQEALWSNRSYPPGILRTKPIIRLETGEHIAPFNDRDEVQVYLPTETKSRYKTVKRIFTKDNNSLKFLKALGITEPSLFTYIEEMIFPKYLKDGLTKDKGYFEDFEKLIKAYETIPSDKKDKFKEKLSKTPFVDSINNKTGESHLRKPSEVYFQNKDLKEYFDGYNSVYFVSDELSRKFEKERLELFLKEVGVEDKPRRISFPLYPSWEEKNKLIDGSKGYCTNFIDYDYEGLENLIKKVTIKKSLLLWKLILKSISNLNLQEGQNFFKRTYIWEYYSKNIRYLDAKFLITLRSQPWLVDKHNNFRKPGDITFSELSDDYIKEGQSATSVLIRALEFKPDIMDQLPESDKQILKFSKENHLSFEDIKRLFIKDIKETETQQENEVSNWTPNCEPGTYNNIEITERKPDKIVSPDLSGQGEQVGIVGDEEITNKAKKPIEKDTDRTPVDRKAIGKWGEKQVYLSLKEKYQKEGSITETDTGFKVEGADNELFEIVWLNKQSEEGEGYDFKIKKNGEEIEYIEVKTKTQEKPESFEVTGMQWGFAMKLFDKSEGDKYRFFVVSNAGNKPKVEELKNPIKLWNEGKIHANPVSIIL